MPIQRIPYGEWLPDKGNVDHNGLYKVDGVVRHLGQWYPAPAFLGATLVGGSAPYLRTEIGGMWVHIGTSTPDDVWVFVGTSDRILRANKSLTTANATAAAIAPGFDETSGWQFTSYGDQVWASSYNAHMWSTPAPGTNFDNTGATGGIIYTVPNTYRPRARYITTIKNHLLIGHISFDVAPSTIIPTSALTGTFYPSMVMWSATDGPRRFGDPSAIQDPVVLGSDYQDLLDEHGPITGISGGEQAYIFKPKAIYLMDGPPWTFHPISIGYGTIYPNSIVRYYNDIYFWGPAGPSRIRAGSSEIEVLGNGKISRSICSQVNNEYFKERLVVGSIAYGVYSTVKNSSPIDISAAVDYASGLVVFFSKSIVNNVPNFIRNSPAVVFDVNSGEFSFFQASTEVSFAKSYCLSGRPPSSVVTMSQDTTNNKVLDGIFTIYLDGSSGAGADDAQLAVTFGMFAGTVDPYTQKTPDPYFEWPYVSLGSNDESMPVSSRIKRIRIPYRCLHLKGDERLAITVTIETLNRYTVPTATVEQEERHSITRTYSPNDTYQEPDDWIELSESTYGRYHKISITFATTINTTGQCRHISGLMVAPYIEVEYEQAGESGSQYLTT